MREVFPGPNYTTPPPPSPPPSPLSLQIKMQFPSERRRRRPRRCRDGDDECPSFSPPQIGLPSSFPLPSPESIVLTTFHLRHLVADQVNHARFRLPTGWRWMLNQRRGRRKLWKIPIPVWSPLTSIVAARSVAPRPSSPSTFEVPSISGSPACAAPVFFSVAAAESERASLFSGESVIKYRKRGLRRLR